VRSFGRQKRLVQILCKPAAKSIFAIFFSRNRLCKKYHDSTGGCVAGASKPARLAARRRIAITES
jgi:hypothetical protein